MGRHETGGGNGKGCKRYLSKSWLGKREMSLVGPTGPDWGKKRQRSEKRGGLLSLAKKTKS